MDQKIRLVHREKANWSHLASLAFPPLPHEAQIQIGGIGSNSWITQTWIHLKRLGLPVELAADFRMDSINIVHYDHLTLRRLPFRSFVVAVQADRGRPEMCDMRVVQNQLCIQDPTKDFWIPLWTQPGLVPRHLNWGSRLERIAYFGLDIYLAERFRSDDFQRRLAGLGMEFCTHFDRSEYFDYSDVDAVLAVRDVSEYDLSIKPPTKLLNAWRAGVIPLMGLEPAYQQVGKPGVDYFEVRSPDDVLKAIARLRSEPGLMERTIQAGTRRFSEFTDEAIAKRWIEFLRGPAEHMFLAWARRNGGLGYLGTLVGYPARYLRHRREKRRFLELI